MGEAAVVMQEYLGDAYRFADLFNVMRYIRLNRRGIPEDGETTDEKGPGMENTGKNTGM